MRNSWSFSTAIFEIWVLVLTKPGWANETPMTSLRDSREYNDYSHSHHHYQHHHPSHRNHHHYSSSGGGVAEGIKEDFSNRNHHHLHPTSSFYSNSGNSFSNNNRHYGHHHLQSAAALASSSSLYSPHRCYVCLPPNKNSREAQQILEIFAKELRPLIPDCAVFDPYVDSRRFEFDCPPKYGGCILRIHGSNVSRACSKYRVNDCKKANSVEFCYCTTPLCNAKKPEPVIIPEVVVQQVSSTGNEGELRRRGSNDNNRAKTFLRTTGEAVGNSHSIQSRVDDEVIQGPQREDDDEDNGGSGTGSTDQHNTFIDPYASTMDPTIFHEETVAVDIEDPNPHTKIGISMTASTSSSASSLLGESWWSSHSPDSNNIFTFSHDLLNYIDKGFVKKSNTRNIFKLFLRLSKLHVSLLPEDAVNDHVHLYPFIVSKDYNNSRNTATDVDTPHHYLYSKLEYLELGQKVVIQREKKPPGASPLKLPLFFNSQLCFTISFLLVLKLLSS